MFTLKTFGTVKKIFYRQFLQHLCIDKRLKCVCEIFLQYLQRFDVRIVLLTDFVELAPNFTSSLIMLFQ